MEPDTSHNDDFAMITMFDNGGIRNVKNGRITYPPVGGEQCTESHQEADELYG